MSPHACVPCPSHLEISPYPSALGRLAEHESWRKEVHRPATYVHKWWARRLGTVFRATLLQAVGRKDGNEVATALDGIVVFDPFAGAGTTIVEAVKLGARAIGRDINPVATLTQRQAVQQWDPERLRALFGTIESKCGQTVDDLHIDSSGRSVLQYFWVALADCPTCLEGVELFSTYLFAKHAYPQRFPRAQATCPRCHAVCEVMLDRDEAARCRSCRKSFSLDGPVRGRFMTCSRGHRASVLEALGGRPPRREMFAKLVVDMNGVRSYLPIDDFDRELYDKAAKLLANAQPDELVLPDGQLAQGVNTIQALNWGYRDWRSFFNDRQLYSLGLIGAALRSLPASPEAEALVAAFGKTLEHHNVFCSYKGEGTGPVRSIFHNHVLRPERVSTEGNPWGTHGGSGCYSDVLDRLGAAQGYKSQPVDLVLRAGGVTTTRGRSGSLSRPIVTSWSAFARKTDAVYIGTGTSAETDLPDGVVDLVVTDPPYVDNVQYSELADFYHAWLRGLRPYTGYPSASTTRDTLEVQNADPDAFRRMLTDVWKECHRVLADAGLMVFSFHQSDVAGWAALMQSLRDAEFRVTAVHPVVAEVSTSLSKVGAAAPNKIDVMVVCRKKARARGAGSVSDPAQATRDCLQQLRRIQRAGVALGEADVLTATRAAVLATGTTGRAPSWRLLTAEADVLAAQALDRWRTRPTTVGGS